MSEAPVMSDELVIVVLGTIAGQGSKTRTKYGMRDDNSERLRPWRAKVTDAADRAMFGLLRPFNSRGVPVDVTLTFTLARPRSHYGTGRNAGVLRVGAPARPTVTPDIDKAVRAIFDALTDAGCWDDDRQVVDLYAHKRYPHGGLDALEVPGAVIRVRAL